MNPITPIFHRRLPKSLKGLQELALDLRLNESLHADRIWEMLDPEVWERTRNPQMILQEIPQERLEQAAKNNQLKKELQSLLLTKEKLLTERSWFAQKYPRSPLRAVAYFSMEFGLSEALPIYSGGLGILAGDHLKSAGDLGIPIVGIGLLYQQGYFRQVLNLDGSQVEAFPYNDPLSLPVTPVVGKNGSLLRSKIRLPGRDLFLRLWQAQVGITSLYLLDSNDPLNSPWDRGITATLYSPSIENRFIQELVLGFGGWRALEDMGIEVDVIHLNEGHAAFVILARAYSFMRKTGLSFSEALWATRAGNVFTTHTPVAAGFDRFDRTMLKQYAEYYANSVGLSIDELQSLGQLGDQEGLVNASLAMRGCCFVNGVSKFHGQVSRKIFQHLYPRWPHSEVPVNHITNGIHIPSWDFPQARALWDQIEKDPMWWCKTSGISSEAMDLEDSKKIWQVRCDARLALVNYVRRRFVRQLKEHSASPEFLEKASQILDPNVLTIGFARRIAAYKRPTLLLHDQQRLQKILLDQNYPVQLILAGKAHPHDEEGKRMVQQLAQFASQPELFGHIVFMEDYDIGLARRLLAGVDLWVNVPRSTMEACGTSGMKVLVNGGLNLSELDGWWAEAFFPGVGWALGDGKEHDDTLELDKSEAEQLYELLENEIIPEFYNRDQEGIPRAWMSKIRSSMARLVPKFSSHRMVREYMEKAYIPAAEAYKCRSSDNAKLASELSDWQNRLNSGWKDLHFGNSKVSRVEGTWRFEVEIFFGRIDPNDVRVELYAEREDGGAEKSIGLAMVRDKMISPELNGYLYIASVPDSRPAEHYTPRIIPFHPHAFIPLEVNHILWLH
ncbi:MAG: alpha-glucan family phosphorylase [Methanotrichaceae archaeon]|nr:alpha-glucan family phosphorylase [Methanotrichaceae archaeon]